jgi:hypothetical protein
VIFRPADLPTESSAQRAHTIADALNKLLRDNPAQWEVRLSPDGNAVYVRQVLVVDVTPDDAALAELTPEVLAAQAKQSIQAAIVREQMRFMY